MKYASDVALHHTREIMGIEEEIELFERQNDITGEDERAEYLRLLENRNALVLEIGELYLVELKQRIHFVNGEHIVF